MSLRERDRLHRSLRIDAIESVVADAVRGPGDRALAVAVVDASSPLADFGRAIEAARFPEYDMATAMAPFEASSLFLYTVDVEHRRIAHVKRLVRGRSAEEVAATGRTGIEVIDDRLEATDPAEHAELAELFGQFGITDPSKVWNIATSCATERIAPTRHRPYSLLTYKGLLFLTQPIHVDHFFAYVNRKTIRSMNRLGIPSTIVGDSGYHMPSADGYELEYVAIHMTPDPATIRAFTVFDPDHPLSRPVAEANLPVVVLVDDEAAVLDLTDAVASEHVELLHVDLPDVIDLTDGPVLDLTDDDVVIDLTDSTVNAVPLPTERS